MCYSCADLLVLESKRSAMSLHGHPFVPSSKGPRTCNAREAKSFSGQALTGFRARPQRYDI